ncbi:TPA: IS3 family transposase, partial [Klebsiella pneumoniae]|nr:IS3 family transposase [Klebsiella pneumoniae]
PLSSQEYQDLPDGAETTLTYNECRPHSALNYQTPSEFAARWRNVKCEGKQTDLTN